MHISPGSVGVHLLQRIMYITSCKFLNYIRSLLIIPVSKTYIHHIKNSKHYYKYSARFKSASILDIKTLLQHFTNMAFYTWVHTSDFQASAVLDL
jgi:hypothetical protein